MIRVLTWVVLAASCVLAGAPTFDEATKLYNRTDYEGALQLLLTAPAKTAGMYDLIGRCYYMVGDFKKATEVFERAVAVESGSSGYHHWLGRAYGRRAETSSPFTAPGYASKARQNFERAVELDPGDMEALDDLLEYYLQAPGFLGGGMDKAQALMKRFEKVDPVQGYYARARLAERRKEFDTAEEQFRRAAELAPKQVGRVLDLAKFLARQGKQQESEQAFERAEAMAPNHPRVLFERAETYIQSKRNLDQARDLLKRYLQSSLTPEDHPRFEAEKLLREAGGA
jgi:tetratricopeptide (TPR) repeat protein